MADAAVAEQLRKLTEAIGAMGKPPKAEPTPPIWKTVGYWIPIVLAALALIGVEARFSELGTELHRLDDRLTPAINGLTAQISTLNTRLSVDEATTPQKKPR